MVLEIDNMHYFGELILKICVIDMLFVSEYFRPFLEVGMGCLGKKFVNDRLQKGINRFMATVLHLR